MGPDDVQIKFSAEDDGFASAAQKEVQQINQLTAAREASNLAERQMLALRQTIRQVEREQRKAEFDRLPLEEQVNRLLQRREELQRRLSQAKGGGALSERTKLAYEAATKLNDFQLGDKQAQLGKQQMGEANRAARQKQMAEDVAANQAALAKRQELERRLGENQRQLFQFARKDREEAFNALKPKEQLLALESKRERLQRFITQAGDNELRRSQLLVSLRRTQGAIGEARANAAKQPSFLGSVKEFASSQVGQLFSGAGLAYAFAKVKEQVAQTMEEATRIKDLSERLGTDTSSAQQFRYAGNKTNLSEEDIGTGFKSLRLAQEKGQRGDKDTLAIFERFGVSAQQLRQAKPDELFKQIAKNAQSGKAAAASLTDATEVFGRGADRVLVALRGGFADAMDEIASTGGIIDPQTIVELDDASKSLTLLGNVLTAYFAPAIALVIEKLTASLPELIRLGSNIPGMGTFRFLGTLAGGGSLADASRSAAFGGNDLGDDIEARMHRSELNKKAKEDAIKFREDQATKLNAAVEAESNPQRKRELATEVRKNANELEILKTNTSPELERQARLEELKKQVAELQAKTAFDRLSKEEKIAFLQGEKAKDAAKLTANSDEEDKARSALRQAQLDQQLAGLEKDTGAGKQEAPRADALRRVGLFRGGVDMAVPNAIKEQKQTLTRIATGIEKVERNTAPLRR